MSGKGLFQVIVNEIKNIRLNINNLRGQEYDHGSNMKEKYLRVQKRHLDTNSCYFISHVIVII